MDDLNVRRIHEDDENCPYDSLTLLRYIANAIGDRGFILIVQDENSGETRQFSNGDIDAQLAVLVRACEAMKASISGTTH